MTDRQAHHDIRYILVAGGLSLALLMGAWIFQYGFGYAPCQMCYWQRYGHMAVIAAAVSVLALRRLSGLSPNVGVIILVLLLLGSAGLGLFHAGVELDLWEGPQSCSGIGGTVTIDPDNPLAGLDQPIKAPSCNDIAWSFLGLSMAAWNGLISLLGALLVGWPGFRRP